MDSTGTRYPEPIMRVFPPYVRLSANRPEGDGSIQGGAGYSCSSSVYVVFPWPNAVGSASAYARSITPEPTPITPALEEEYDVYIGVLTKTAA
jgi:hypothetical protein